MGTAERQTDRHTERTDKRAREKQEAQVGLLMGVRVITYGSTQPVADGGNAPHLAPGDSVTASAATEAGWREANIAPG